MTINIKDETIDKLSEKLKEFEKEVADSDDEKKELLALLKANAGKSLIKHMNNEDLTLDEAKALLIVSWVILQLTFETIEELTEYPEVAEWAKKLLP